MASFKPTQLPGERERTITILASCARQLRLYHKCSIYGYITLQSIAWLLTWCVELSIRSTGIYSLFMFTLCIVLSIELHCA